MVKARGNLLVYIISMVVITLWGLSYIWNDQLLAQGVRVEYFVFVRTVEGSLLLLVMNLLMGKSIKMDMKDLPYFLLLAVCEPLVYFTCETYGIQLTESPTYSALIIAATPIVATIAGILFFKEKLRPMNYFGIAVCLAGLVLVTLSADTIGDKFIWGVILLIFAVFAEVGHASFTKKLAFKYEPTVIVMYQFMIGCIYLLPLFLTRGLGDFTPELYLSWSVWKPILFLAFFCSGISFSLWVTSIRELGVAKSSVFQAMIPVVTAIAGIVLGTEILSPLQWIGIAVAIAGLIMNQYNPKIKNS